MGPGADVYLNSQFYLDTSRLLCVRSLSKQHKWRYLDFGFESKFIQYYRQSNQVEIRCRRDDAQTQTAHLDEIKTRFLNLFSSSDQISKHFYCYHFWLFRELFSVFPVRNYLCNVSMNNISVILWLLSVKKLYTKMLQNMILFLNEFKPAERWIRFTVIITCDHTYSGAISLHFRQSTDFLSVHKSIIWNASILVSQQVRTYELNCLYASIILWFYRINIFMHNEFRVIHIYA